MACPCGYMLIRVVVSHGRYFDPFLLPSVFRVALTVGPVLWVPHNLSAPQHCQCWPDRAEISQSRAYEIDGVGLGMS